VGAPLFSIVTIAFQNIDGLRATVDSLKPQSFRDYEHIVIDAGSTDGSAEWLAANFDGTWLSEPDGGRYHGMNKGARLSRGEYVWFMHAGDVFGDAGVLSRVAAAIERAGRPDWLYGMARLVGPDKSVLGLIGFVPFSMFNFAILNGSLPHQASAYRRDFFWRLGGYDENFGIASDQLLMVHAANSSPPLALADFLCDYDSTGTTSRRSWWKHPWDTYRIRRLTRVPITGVRALDHVLAVGYELLRLFGLSLRPGLRRVDASTTPSSETNR
jgi:glycosyltransferase involved in cell wall biosynthesis